MNKRALMAKSGLAASLLLLSASAAAASLTALPTATSAGIQPAGAASPLAAAPAATSALPTMPAAALSPGSGLPGGSATLSGLDGLSDSGSDSKSKTAATPRAIRPIRVPGTNIDVPVPSLHGS